jgi:hypothetical protein
LFDDDGLWRLLLRGLLYDDRLRRLLLRWLLDDDGRLLLLQGRRRSSRHADVRVARLVISVQQKEEENRRQGDCADDERGHDSRGDALPVWDAGGFRAHDLAARCGCFHDYAASSLLFFIV